MKRILISTLMAISLSGFSQVNLDTLKEKIDEHNAKLNALDERLSTDEADLFKLAKIKISGYIQAQWQHREGYDYTTSGKGYQGALLTFGQFQAQNGGATTLTGAFPQYGLSNNNTFFLRRARIKFTYEPADGIAFVLQPDLSTGGLALKDAYALANFKFCKGLALWAGQFNRPNYEVEYSSSSREVLERSMVIQKLYPGEREIGTKIEYNSPKIPLHVQLALLNGNFANAFTRTSTNKATIDAVDNDPQKDVMARAYYTIKLKSISWLGIDIGTHGYFGNVNSDINTGLIGSNYKLYIQNSNYTSVKRFDSPASVATDKYSIDSTKTPGACLKKQWFGGEMRIYLDILGGLAIKGEFIAGQNIVSGSTTTASTTYKIDTLTGKSSTTIGSDGAITVNTVTSTKNSTNPTTYLNGTAKTTISPFKIRQFSGFYVYFIKNIGKKNQFVLRYDVYDPNTKVKGDGVNTSSDIAISTIALAWQYYFNDNIRITLQYDMPQNEKSNNAAFKTSTATVVSNLGKDVKDNMLSVRVQAKF
ncbi:MAG: porin [Bacteroidales bacterium]|jgi:hypothetical protein